MFYYFPEFSMASIYALPIAWLVIIFVICVAALIGFLVIATILGFKGEQDYWDDK